MKNSLLDERLIKDSNSTYLMTKKDLNKSRTKSVVLKCTISEEQERIIENLVGLIGNNKQDVAGKILTLWLYNEGYLKAGDKKDDKK